MAELRKTWSGCSWLPLDHHNDNICSLALSDSTLLSGSRDTTCGVWEGEHTLHTLGDHTSTVTAVFLVEGKAFTTSYDCCLRKWDVESGKLEHSHYLYSPIM